MAASRKKKSHSCSEWDLVAEFPDGLKLLYLDQHSRADLAKLIKAVWTEQRKRKRRGDRHDYALRTPIEPDELVHDTRS